MKTNTKLALQLFLLLLTVASLTSCTKEDKALPPVPDFTFTGGGMAPDTIAFTNKSSNALSYTWDFGDGTTSREESPTHVFKKAGNLAVTLTTWGRAETKTITKTVTMTAPTSAKITAVRLSDIQLFKPNDYGWDDGSGPDIFYKLMDADFNLIATSA